MRPGALRVVKVGGSLWDLPQLAEVLPRWIATQPPARNVLVAGGGAWAEEIRHLDRLRGLSPMAAHWLAIRAMSLTGWLLCHMLQACGVGRSADAAQVRVLTQGSGT